MHCIRRAAIRAACSSSSFVARQRVTPIAMQLSKANVRPAVGILPVSRYFSQTARVAEELKDETEAAEDTVGATILKDAALESSPTEQESPLKQSHGLFISNMSFEATDAHLEEAFGKYGELSSTSIARDGRGLSRGFGFVVFSTQEAADRAVREANGSFWHGRRISVQYRKEGVKSSTNRAAEPTKSVYVGNIPYETSDADLNEMFRALEGVTDVRVAVDRNTGWPRGFAHADFKDIESATKARDYLNDLNLGGRKLRADFASIRQSYTESRPRPSRDSRDSE
ncbi:RNA-binding domain-containing protein [Xylaria palmicola]|nr:RNA-binding domain-containing protein [Xylaria palmicola]